MLFFTMAILIHIPTNNLSSFALVADAVGILSKKESSPYSDLSSNVLFIVVFQQHPGFRSFT